MFLPWGWLGTNRLDHIRIVLIGSGWDIKFSCLMRTLVLDQSPGAIHDVLKVMIVNQNYHLTHNLYAFKHKGIYATAVKPWFWGRLFLGWYRWYSSNLATWPGPSLSFFGLDGTRARNTLRTMIDTVDTVLLLHQSCVEYVRITFFKTCKHIVEVYWSESNYSPKSTVLSCFFGLIGRTSLENTHEMSMSSRICSICCPDPIFSPPRHVQALAKNEKAKSLQTTMKLLTYTNP